MPKTSNALVSCEWLRKNLDCPKQIILEATFFLPRQQRNAQAEFSREHIAGARFFDIDKIANTHSPLAHTLPDSGQFARQVAALGIDNDTRVIIYDRNHFFASARVWWMFRVFGHDMVKVLDGGLLRWQQCEFPLTAALTPPEPKEFKAHFRAELLFDLDQMIRVQRNTDRQILDARSEDSFTGQRPLSEPGLHPGHIPGSINLPYRKLYTDDDHTLLPPDLLQQILVSANVDISKPMVTSCGSGVSAALLLLALYQLGIGDVPMFDGSWAQWGRQAHLPRSTES